MTRFHICHRDLQTDTSKSPRLASISGRLPHFSLSVTDFPGNRRSYWLAKPPPHSIRCRCDLSHGAGLFDEVLVEPLGCLRVLQSCGAEDNVAYSRRRGVLRVGIGADGLSGYFHPEADPFRVVENYALRRAHAGAQAPGNNVDSDERDYLDAMINRASEKAVTDRGEREIEFDVFRGLDD